MVRKSLASIANQDRGGGGGPTLQNLVENLLAGTKSFLAISTRAMFKSGSPEACLKKSQPRPVAGEEDMMESIDGCTAREEFDCVKRNKRLLPVNPPLVM